MLKYFFVNSFKQQVFHYPWHKNITFSYQKNYKISFVIASKLAGSMLFFGRIKLIKSNSSKVCYGFVYSLICVCIGNLGFSVLVFVGLWLNYNLQIYDFEILGVNT